MSKNEHNPPSYEIRYNKKFLSFFFGGHITIVCPDIIDLNPELHEVLPNLTFYEKMGFLEMYKWYECPIKNDKEANEYIIELKLRGYKVISERIINMLTVKYYD